MNEYEKSFVVVTDTIKNGDKSDLSDALQRLIEDNPNRTIFFPDGEYVLAKPIKTPADPRKSVDLRLSSYAVIRAADGWNDDEAMIRLGAICPANDIATPGSCYSLTGGIIDGGGKAAAVSIDGGRETAVRMVSIKNTVLGLHIKRGANSGSSDSDISDVNIVGAGGDSIGVLVEGYDNTFTNMRIANVSIGIKLCSSGNVLRNLHPLYYVGSGDYEKSCGFCDMNGDNWYEFCYSDQFRRGFFIGGGRSSVYGNCFCFWYSDAGKKQTAIHSGGKFNSLVTSIKSGFHGGSEENVVLEVDEPGGAGVIQNILTNPHMLTDDTYKEYLTGRIIG